MQLIMKNSFPAKVSRWGLAGGAVLGCIPLGYLGYSLFLLRFFSGHTYSWLLDYYQRTWPDAFDVETVSGYFFTAGWHAWLTGHVALVSGVIWAVIGGYVVFSPWMIGFLARFLGEMAQGFRFLRGVFRELSAARRRWLFALFGAMLLYWGYLFAASSGMWLDEACSYLHFVRGGVLLTITSYPVPNNHILFNAICALLARLSFLPPVWVMRLPSVAASLLDYYLIFCVFKRWGDFRRAMVVVAGVAFVHMLSYYSVQGRGYQLQLLFIVVNALSGWYYFFAWPGGGGAGRSGYYLFVVSAILGFYVNPLFVYHFGAMLMAVGYGMWRKRDAAMGRRLALAVAIVAGTVAVLYLPLVLGSGPHAIAGNRYVANRPLGSLVTNIRVLGYDLAYIFYYGYFTFILMAGLFIAYVRFYRRRRFGGFFYDHANYYLVASVVSIGLMTIYERIYPLERSLCFWVLALNVLFVNCCYDLSFRFFPRRAFRVVLLLLLVKDISSIRLLFLDHYSVRNSEDGRIFSVTQPLYPQLRAMHPASYQVTNSEDSYPVYLRLYLLAHHDSTPVVFSREKPIGTIILANDSDARRLPLQGYERWADKDGRWAFDLDGHVGVYVLKPAVSGAVSRPVSGPAARAAP